jgi:hypothetical protein
MIGLRSVRSLSMNFVAASRVLSLSTATARRIVDVTGNPVTIPTSSSSSKAILSLIDDSIMQMILHSNDPVAALRKMRSTVKDVGMIPGLVAWQLMRQPRRGAKQDANEVASCLAELEALLADGKLNKREEFVASAALAFSGGHYYKAAALLETSMLTHSQDLLALKLAQDCYLTAGDSHNVLGCVARWMQLFDERSELYGHVMGLFAAGLVEVGRLVEAEEVANRAVTRTKGDDVWALHSLLNTYQLLGRSSEVIAILNDHLPRHMKESSVGQQLLMFNKGSASIQRGNYTGALRIHDDMVYNICSPASIPGYGNDATVGDQLAGPMTDATLLLWQIALHSSSLSVGERWTFPQAVSNLWAVGDQGGTGRPFPADAMSGVCQAMAFSAAEQAARVASMSPSERDDASSSADDSRDEVDISRVEKNSDSAMMVAVEAKSKAIWEWFRHANNPLLAAQQAANSSSSAVAQAEAEAVAAVEALSQRTAADHHDSLQRLLSLLADSPGLVPETAPAPAYPQLSAVVASVSVVKRIQEASATDSTALSDRDWALSSVASPASQAVAAFSCHDYASAVDLFRSRGQQHVLRKIGGTAVQRDVIEQTVIEALLRSGQLVEAQLALCERTTLAPNDAQAWRRLASVFGRNGLPDLAKVAHYTAWQLGIGQGGFGGPT